MPAPSGVNVEPPLADLGKSAQAEDDSRLVWLLLRARDEDGKYRFLLQQRPDGTWGMPGGKPHIGEDAWVAAMRETTEEIGRLPAQPRIVGTFHHVEDDGKTQVYLWLCDIPYFHPTLDGETPEETRGAAWFRRKEVGNLDLAPKFREDWERGITLREHVTKAAKPLQRMVNENGETLTLTPASQALQAVGSRWPYPKRSDGAEWPDSGPGNAAGAMGASEPPHQVNDMAEVEPHDTLEPRGGDDGEMPSQGRKPNPPADAFPNQGYAHDEMWPEPQATLTPAASPVGGNTGVPPSGKKQAKVSKLSVNYRPADGLHCCGNCVMYQDRACDLVAGQISPEATCDRWEPLPAEKNDAGHPVVGSVPAEAPAPYAPHTIEPQAFDPSETVETWSPQAGSNVVHNLPGAHKGAGGPSDFSDANPVDPETVYLQLAANFPADSIAWVKRASWVGPIWVPWDRVDTDDRDEWAASKQPRKVREFTRQIQDHSGHVAPSVLVQEPGKQKAFIVDGHHRALAREQLGQRVLAYLGNINPKDREAAEQTHSFQFHSGSDPQNR